MRLASEYSALLGLLPWALTASYTYCMTHHGISQFVYKGCEGTHKATQVSKLYTSLQRLYQNAICIRVFRLGWYTAMRIIGILHLLYDVPWQRPVCVQTLLHFYGNVSQTAVYIRTAGVPKCG